MKSTTKQYSAVSPLPGTEKPQLSKGATFVINFQEKMHPIIQTLQQNLPTLKEKYPLLSLGVFGSYSRGEETPNSDLDIVYESLPHTFLNLYNYLDLQKDLNRITNLKIDLVNKKYMNEVIWLTAKNDVIYV